MAPITAERIESLLLPQNWKRVKKWNKACTDLIDDFRAVEADPRHNVLFPDMTRWTGDARPKWQNDRWPGSYTSSMKTVEFVNPTFAWFCISMWSGATDYNVSGLFHVLMRCGCDSAAALGAATSSGRVVLQFAAEAATMADDPGTDSGSESQDYEKKVPPHHKRALTLLMARPNLPLFANNPPLARPLSDAETGEYNGPFCCALCTMVHNELDDFSVRVLVRLTPDQRLAAVTAPHWAFALANRWSCPHTFEELWKVVRDRVMQPDCDAVEVDRLISGPVSGHGYQLTAFAMAAVWGEASAWKLVTNAHCPLATAMLRHANQHPERQYRSPLFTIRTTYQTDSETDVRGEWLVSRLCADVLNAYDESGRTPVMNAAGYVHPKTLKALLNRGTEVDLAAQETQRRFPVTTTPVDALARADTKFNPINAADMMSTDFPALWKRLSAETDAQIKLRPAISAAVMPALGQFGGGAQMPHELVRLCLAYAGLPEPVASPAPVPSVCAGAKRSATASAGAGGSGSDANTGDNADRSKRPPTKRLRLT